MKYFIFILTFFISSIAFSQQNDGVIKVRKKLNSTPMIAGVAGGDIEGSLLCSQEGIVINKNTKVKSFIFIVSGTSGKEISIKHNGNILYKEACEIVSLLKSGAEVYINEIAIVDNKGREALATPMRFRIK